MAEPDYRAMLTVVMSEWEDTDDDPWWMPNEAIAWWRASPERAEREADAKRKAEAEEIRWAREHVEGTAERVAAWRERCFDHAWAQQQLAAAEETHEQALATLKSLTADEASAMAAPQAADPAGLGSRIEKPIPHPIPHESPKEG